MKFLSDKRVIESARKFISELKDAVSDSDMETKRKIENIEKTLGFKG